MTAPPLKTDPKYGYFPHWPQDGNDWVHPDDVATARAMIPSQRVFRRDGVDGEYCILHYGDVTLRAKPALWQEVEPEGIEIGDWVEVIARGMLNEPRTGDDSRDAVGRERTSDPLSNLGSGQADPESVRARGPSTRGTGLMRLEKLLGSHTFQPSRRGGRTRLIGFFIVDYFAPDRVELNGSPEERANVAQ